MMASEPILPAIIGPGADADADVERRPPFGRPLLVQPVQLANHLERRLDRMIGMLGIVERRAEQRHHHVADELVERALVREDDLDHAREVLVQHRDDLFRLPVSDTVVKPRMSENSTVISRRWPPSRASAGLATSWS